MKKYKFKIENLDCASCANELECALQRIPNVENVAVSFIMQRLTFLCEEENLEKVVNEMKKVIKKKEPDVVIKEY